MKNTENKKGHGTAVKAIVLAVPFVIISVAIVLMTLWLFNNVIASFPLYGLLVSSKYTNENSDYVQLDEEYKAMLAQKNADIGLTPEGFPVIPYGSEWARLTIEGTERVQNVRVNSGDDYSLMIGAVGFYRNSDYVGFGGKTVLCGHVKQEFKELETVPVGTKVYMNTVYGDYVYEVYDTVIFRETEPQYVFNDGTEKDVLMIYTCYPYASSTRRTQRFALMCKKVSGKDWTGGLISEGS